MARLTARIDGDLLRQLKAEAARQRVSLDEVVGDLLRLALDKRARPFRLKFGGWKATLRPGVDLSSRRRLYDLMDGTDGH
jgi:hypothetical protein